MSKILWMSDLHLNFLKNPLYFFKDVEGKMSKECKHIVLTGDTAESHNIVALIERMELNLGKPVHFVLGNHDFYGSDIKTVRNDVKHLNYIPRNMGTPLSDKTILIGVDGWGDCRNGDYERSTYIMNDWIHIKDFNIPYSKGQKALKKALQGFADGEARKLKRRLEKAVKSFSNIIITSHVPPFEEACLNGGHKSTPSGLPFFSSKILGDTILPFAEEFSEIRFLWLCGHTHSRVTLHVKHNLTVKVAPSEYYYPTIAEEIEYE